MGVSPAASVILQNRKSHCPIVPHRNWCFRVWLPIKTNSDQESKILPDSRKWTFLLRLLSFCRVEHTMALQKITFPSLWQLQAEAGVVLQRRTYPSASESGVSIFLRIARFAIKAPAGQLLIYVCSCVSESGVSIFLGIARRGWCRSAKSKIPMRFRKWCFRLFGHCALRRQSAGRPAAYLMCINIYIYIMIMIIIIIIMIIIFIIVIILVILIIMIILKLRMFLRHAAQDLACRHTFDMKSMLLKTSAYVNNAATKVDLQKALPTLCASL